VGYLPLLTILEVATSISCLNPTDVVSVAVDLLFLFSRALLAIGMPLFMFGKGMYDWLIYLAVDAKRKTFSEVLNKTKKNTSS